MDLIRTFLLMTLSLSLSWATRKRFDGYQKWELTITKKHQPNVIKHLYEDKLIEADTPIAKVGQPKEIIVSPLKIGPVRKIMFDSHIPVKVLSTNIQRQYDSLWKRLDVKLDYDPNDWNNLTLIHGELDRLASSCAEGVVCSTYSVGTSYEGRELKVLSIAREGEDRPGIWLDSLIHSNEWLAGATLMRIADYLITGYAEDDNVKRLINTYDFYILPVMNPDGYEYQWNTDISWRKSRTINNGTDCVGVDLNRNYDYFWGSMFVIYSGADTDPCAWNFRGPAAASEPETQAIQTEAQRIASGIVLWISYHITAYAWLTPFGYAIDEGVCNYPTNYDNQLRVGEAAVAAIIDTSGDERWVAGTACDIMYDASGITIDYMHGETNVPYSFTPELRSMGNYDPSTIEPSFQENWAALVATINEIEEIASETQ